MEDMDESMISFFVSGDNRGNKEMGWVQDFLVWFRGGLVCEKGVKMVVEEVYGNCVDGS